MRKSLGTLVVVAGLMAVAGCARENRWTMDGSKPKALDDRTQADIAIAPQRAGMPRERHTPESAFKKVQLVQDGDVCKVRCGDSAWPITAKIQVQPGAKNTPPELGRTVEVVVLPDSETLVGRTRIEGAPDEWSYRLLSADYNKRR